MAFTGEPILQADNVRGGDFTVPAAMTLLGTQLTSNNAAWTTAIKAGQMLCIRLINPDAAETILYTTDATFATAGLGARVPPGRERLIFLKTLSSLQVACLSGGTFTANVEIYY